MPMTSPARYCSILSAPEMNAVITARESVPRVARVHCAPPGPAFGLVRTQPGVAGPAFIAVIQPAVGARRPHDLGHRVGQETVAGGALLDAGFQGSIETFDLAAVLAS